MQITFTVFVYRFPIGISNIFYKVEPSLSRYFKETSLNISMNRRTCRIMALNNKTRNCDLCKVDDILGSHNVVAFPDVMKETTCVVQTGGWGQN